MGSKFDSRKMPDMKEWARNRYRLFNEKIDSLSDHPKYAWLRQYADEAICYNSGDGYYQIKAADFIERIEKMPVEYIRDWLDGKNKLEWGGYQDATESK